MKVLSSSLILSLAALKEAGAFVSPISTRTSVNVGLGMTMLDENSVSRRSIVQTVPLAIGAFFVGIEAAKASGGSVAGKYTSIPNAKRRYYGRVKQGVYEFMLMAPAAANADVKDPNVANFFGDNVIVTEGGRKQNCEGDERSCTTDEKRTSRFEDFKTSSYLLANAFRYDAQTPPDRIKQVKKQRLYIMEFENMKKDIKKGDGASFKKHFTSARAIIDSYLDCVDLPPTDDDMYSKPVDTRPEMMPRIT